MSSTWSDVRAPLAYAVVAAGAGFAYASTTGTDMITRVYGAATAGILVFLATGGEEWRRRLRGPAPSALGAPIIAIASAPLWYHYAPPDGGPAAFYSTVAQVLPLFFLAAVVDVRVAGPTSHIATLVAVTSTILGEALALNRVAEGEGDRWVYTLVCALLTAVMAGLILPVLLQERAPPERKEQNEEAR